MKEARKIQEIKERMDDGGKDKKQNRVRILGVEIDNITVKETVRRMEKFIADGKPHIVCTPNVDHILLARKDYEFRHILDRADLVTPDGVPLIWASKFLGHPLTERVAGVDLFLAFCEVAAKNGYHLFLLGAGPGIANRAAKELKKKYPQLRIVGTFSPSFKIMENAVENEMVVSLIRSCKPDVLFVALGTPKQEKWIYRHLEKLSVPLCVGVGAAFDFISGNVKRAPQWMQRAGLEWLYRIWQEPRRLWKRYLFDLILFLPLVLKEKFRRGK